jgi:hypothetical protein
MEELIKQAFLHVDIIGPHVQDGHYDLIGPNGEIILPSVWEKVIEPDWAITMHMWPMDKAPIARGHMPPGGIPPGARVPMPGHHPMHAGMRGGPQMPPGMAARPNSARPGEHIIPPPPPGVMPRGFPPGGRPMAANIVDVDPRHGKGGGKKSSKHPTQSFMGGLFGGPKSKPKKYV